MAEDNSRRTQPQNYALSAQVTLVVVRVGEGFG